MEYNFFVQFKESDLYLYIITDYLYINFGVPMRYR